MKAKCIISVIAFFMFPSMIRTLRLGMCATREDSTGSGGTVLETVLLQGMPENVEHNFRFDLFDDIQ